MMNLSQTDLDALERAIAVTRKESAARRQQIDDMLADRDRERVGVFACSCAQSRALRSDPWHTLPMRASLADLDKPADDPRGERRAAELLRRLLDAGLSPFEPNPLQAIAAAEQRQSDEPLDQLPFSPVSPVSTR
jgi:hypothetical protein